MVLAAIPVVMAEDTMEVTLATPLTPAAVEEGRETGLPASPDGGPHSSSSWLEPEVSWGDAAWLEAECPPVGHEIKVVEVSSDGKACDGGGAIGTVVGASCGPIIGWAFQQAGGD
jgi:hypothetical protein